MVEAIAIIGANLAGGRAAESLRQCGFDGRLILIGDEPWLPYERPPLSKEVLWDAAFPVERLFLTDAQWYAANRIDLRLGVRADAIDLAGGTVRLSSGEDLAVERILLATGGRARTLPLAGAGCRNVHHLRTRADAERLRSALTPGAAIVVIGMGVIGAEVAASARKLGCAVAAVEPAGAPMVRALGRRFGDWLAGRHADRGVRTYYGRNVARLMVEGATVRAVELDDGTRLACDAVVVGIGIVPATELARDAGLAVGNGIIVDRQCQTSNAAVYAAGDVADQPSFFAGRTRQETYQNAADQGAAAAQAMLGSSVDYLKPAWFWTDQYDLNIQVSGRIEEDADMILRGPPEGDSFAAFFTRDGVVEGVLTVNRAADMGVGRRLVERRIAADPSVLADPAIPLRTLLNIRPHAA